MDSTLNESSNCKQGWDGPLKIPKRITANKTAFLADILKAGVASKVESYDLVAA